MEAESAVNYLTPEGNVRSTVMVQTILFGTLLGVPMVLVGWLGPGRLWARRQMVTVPEHLAAPPTPAPPPLVGGGVGEGGAARSPSFAMSLLIVVLPLVQSLLGFGAKLLGDVKQLPEWLTEAPVSASELPEALCARMRHEV